MLVNAPTKTGDFLMFAVTPGCHPHVPKYPDKLLKHFEWSLTRA